MSPFLVLTLQLHVVALPDEPVHCPAVQTVHLLRSESKNIHIHIEIGGLLGRVTGCHHIGIDRHVECCCDYNLGNW